jgi:molybdate transport system substrate-binding protein
MPDVVRLLSTLALKGAVCSLAGRYQAAGGARIDADFAPTLGLLDRLRDGAAADVVILIREALGDLSAQGTVVAESGVDLARSYVGIAVKAGAGEAGSVRCAVEVPRLAGSGPGAARLRAGALNPPALRS